MEVFKLFRISLIDEQTTFDMFKEHAKNRQEFLTSIFSERFQFTHRGAIYHYAPVLTSKKPEEILLGRVGKPTKVIENMPPDQGLLEEERESWKAAVMVIDTSHHEDGQKISFQCRSEVGKPKSILKSMANELNSRHKGRGYHMEIEPIFDASSFWDFVKENNGKITRISFTFVAPNMFGSIDSISREMKEFRDEERAQRIRIELSSENGLNAETEKIKNSVDYVAKGGGKITAATHKKKFNSTVSEKDVSIDKITQDEPIIDLILKTLSKIFGRNE